MRIVIIGGGVAGLAIGWRLASAGCEVEILERALAGRASSWAAAGMLAATAETEARNNGVTSLAREGRAAWPKFSADLEEVSGINIDYRVCGSLLIAQSDEREAALKRATTELSVRGENVEWRNAEEALLLEPHLSPAINGALFAPEDAQVDNRKLNSALARAFVSCGGILREQCDVHALDIESGVVRGVVTAEGDVSADRVVIAAGAWSSIFGGIDQSVLPSIRPAKGQMTAVAPPSGVEMPSHLIWGEEIVYLVPRRETLLIGATVEDVGFETSLTQEARDELIARASRLIPSLSSWRVVESWAGLRPRTSDESPVIGATSVDGLFIASGQFRNGILFAPVIADMIRCLVLEVDHPPIFEGFSATRFTTSQLSSRKAIER